MQKIAAIVQASDWTQADAATQCGVTQPRMNDLLRGCVSRFSLDALVNIATAMGQRVQSAWWLFKGSALLCQGGDGEHQGQRIAAQRREAMVLIESRSDVIFGIDHQRKDAHACLHGALPGVP